MKIFNVELFLKDKSLEDGTINDYSAYLKKKVFQLLIMIVIYFVLFYTLSFFMKGFESLHSITPPALQDVK
jgi:hypothetical protein